MGHESSNYHKSQKSEHNFDPQMYDIDNILSVTKY